MSDEHAPSVDDTRLPSDQTVPAAIEQAMEALGDACMAEEDADYSATISYPNDVKIFVVALRYENKYVLKSELGRIADGFIEKTNQKELTDGTSA